MLAGGRWRRQKGGGAREGRGRSDVGSDGGLGGGSGGEG